MFTRIACLCLALVASPVLTARAQDYPNRPVRLILTVEPGGSADASSRVLARHMTDLTKQTYIVENKPGASGTLAVAYENTQKGDGYTLLYSADTAGIAPWLVSNQQQAVANILELTPITIVGVAPFVFVVNPKIPVKTPADLVAYVKSHPDFRWSIGGQGVPGQLSIIRFARLAGLNLDLSRMITYRGNGPATTAVLSGEVDANSAQPPAVLGAIQSGKLIGVGVAGPERLANLPEIPTIASFGYPGFEALSWFGIWGPKDLPPALAKQIRDQVAEATKNPEFTRQFDAIGFKAAVSASPEAFGKQFKEEMNTNGALLKELNIKAE